MMATCMVTCGRGLGNFVWQEILEKIPGTVDLRHLSEGKVAFKICHAVGITDTALMQGQKCVGDGGNLDDNEESREAKKEHNITSPISKELVGTKEMTGEEHTALQRITEPPGIPTEEEDQWVAAISHIYKLRLVERVFTLLHCEDIGELSSSVRSKCQCTLNDTLHIAHPLFSIQLNLYAILHFFRFQKWISC